MEVKEFSFEVLSTAVDFMYGIEIPEDFNNSDDLRSLLHMADQYLMENLKDAVGFLIGKDLNKENIFDTSYLAEKFGALILSEKCAEFIFDNAGAIKDEKLADMKEGVVMASLAKKFVKESKKDNWMKKLFGKKADFKKREDFGSEEDYKGYVMARIKPKMFVSCNQLSSWYVQNKVGRATYMNTGNVKEGEVGLVLKTDSSVEVAVKWLTIPASGDTYHLFGNKSKGSYECLDLLTSPVNGL